jgi:hypothetical protein
VVKEAAALGTTEAEAVRFGTAANGLINKFVLLGVVKATAKVVKGGKGTAKSLSASEAGAVSKEIFHQKQTAPVELQASISRGVTEAVETNPLMKAWIARYRGGSYRDMRYGPKAPMTDAHHMPPRGIVPDVSVGDGPAIQMLQQDHRMTSSWGAGKDAREYRAILQQKIESGDTRGAVATDIWDVKSTTGRKYNEAMLEMVDYGKFSEVIPPKQPKK